MALFKTGYTAAPCTAGTRANPPGGTTAPNCTAECSNPQADAHHSIHSASRSTKTLQTACTKAARAGSFCHPSTQSSNRRILQRGFQKPQCCQPNGWCSQRSSHIPSSPGSQRGRRLRPSHQHSHDKALVTLCATVCGHLKAHIRRASSPGMHVRRPASSPFGCGLPVEPLPQQTRATQGCKQSLTTP